jgi:hypothetical protein
MRARRTTGPGIRRRTAAEWRELVAEQERSHVGHAAFARSRGLNPTTFAWWKCELRRRNRAAVDDGGGPPRFIEVVPERPTVPSAAGLEAVLRSGMVLRALGGVDVDAFVRFVAAMERAC